MGAYGRKLTKSLVPVLAAAREVSASMSQRADSDPDGFVIDPATGCRPVAVAVAGH